MAARRFRRHRLAMIGLVTLLIIVAIAAFLPLLVPLDPIKPSYDNLGMPPSPNHLLGGDLPGRAIFARLVYGTRVPLIPAFGPVARFVTIGPAGGLVAGSSRGR